MSEAILNNMIQSPKKNFFPETKKNFKPDNGKSFSETMREIKQQVKKSKANSNQSSKAIRDKSSKLNGKEFFEKLKETLNKNHKDVPAELLSLLQSGSLTKEQELMLGKLMLNLKNNNLSISELETLLEKNKSDSAAEAQLTQLFNNDKQGTQSLAAADLEESSQVLKVKNSSLSEAEISELKVELDKLTKMFSENADDETVKTGQKTGAEELNNSLAELISTLKSTELTEESLAKLSRQLEDKTPNLNKLLNSEELSLSGLDNNLSSAADSLFAELSAQLKAMLEEQNLKLSAQQSEVKADSVNSEIFSLNSDLASAIESGVKLEANNQNNFFDLDNSNLFFNFEQNSQELSGNFSSEQFSLNSQDTAQAAENVDLRSQVVEQFRGEYSAETKEMQIQLKPESLGKIDISLSYDNEELTGKMLVESEIVRAQLENSLKGLKSDLLKQGINIEQFKIETAKNAPQQVDKQENFAFNQEDGSFGDGETGQNQEYEQRQFFQGQYYVQRNRGSSELDNNSIIMRQQEIINRAAFSNDEINLLA